MVDDGSIERIARGLYRFSKAEPTVHYTLAAICARVPGAIVCLLSALTVYELGTQLPAKVWIALPHKARTPSIPELPIKVVRFSGASLRYGVQSTEFEGVRARITSPGPAPLSTVSASGDWSARTWRSRRYEMPCVTAGLARTRSGAQRRSAVRNRSWGRYWKFCQHESFDPQFTVSHAMKADLTRIERAHGFLKVAAISEDWIRQMGQLTLVLEAHHTTRIEGTRLTLEKSERLLARESVPGTNPDEVRELLNYRNAFEFVSA